MTSDEPLASRNRNTMEIARISVIDKTGICVVQFVEPILRDADRLRHFKNTSRELTARHQLIVVDLARVDYLSSVILGSLVAMHNSAGKRNGRVILCGMKPHIREMFQVTGLDPLFESYETVEEAVPTLGTA